ncbi:MAG: hypothetical protein NTX79_07790 [Candidatus Micrarchaeota archaeon]|nr:hypothetical protein [Candidatus Micrarchaeota archaeon]
MAKIRVICLKAIAPQVVKSLQQLSVLHITDSKLPELERAGPLPSFDEVSSRLVKIRTIKEAFGTAVLHDGRPRGDGAPSGGKPEEGGKIAPIGAAGSNREEGKPSSKKFSFEDPVTSADELISRAEPVFGLASKKDAYAKELDANIAAQKALSEIEGLHLDFSELSSETLQFSLLRAHKKKAKVAREILAATKNCMFASTQSGESEVFLVALPKAADSKFLEGLGQANPLPRISGTPKAEIAHLREKEGEMRKGAEEAGRKLAHLGGAIYPKLVALDEALSIEADRAQVATLFSASAELYFIEGWAEAGKAGRITHEMGQRFGKKIHISQVSFKHDEVPPTLFDNPGAAKPFEYLVEFISTPQYYEIDPTIILAIAVPLTYALIMGDAGYALLSFLLAWLFTRKSKPGGLLHSVALIWMISAIPAFFAGIAFDEYFGFSHSHLLGFTLYAGIHRAVSLTFLMFLSIMIGMAQLALGFILGAINEWSHSRKHAYAKLCWLGVEIAGFVLIGSTVYTMFPGMAIPSAALLALCIGGLVYTEGVIAIIELPSLLGNVMSYLRIAAVGVGGLIIAEAINELLLPRLDISPLGIVVFIITAAIYVAMHLAACCLAMFEALVHGARLSVVEFFGKFYTGGGVRFAPFSAKRVHTQEV